MREYQVYSAIERFDGMCTYFTPAMMSVDEPPSESMYDKAEQHCRTESPRNETQCYHICTSSDSPSKHRGPYPKGDKYNSLKSVLVLTPVGEGGETAA
jgi:hypothetical protein